jgi:hypothetical protein
MKKSLNSEREQSTYFAPFGSKIQHILLLSVQKFVKRQMCIPPHQELSSDMKSG